MYSLDIVLASSPDIVLVSSLDILLVFSPDIIVVASLDIKLLLDPNIVLAFSSIRVPEFTTVIVLVSKPDICITNVWYIVLMSI